MKIGPSIPTNLNTSLQGAGSPTPKVSFREVMEKMSDKIGVSDLHHQTASMRNELARMKSFDPQKLMVFQMQINELHMRTELLSKVAEAGSSTVRKLQSPQ